MMDAHGELHYLQIDELSRLLAARKVSPVELTENMLRRIERLDPALKSYACVSPELALEQARRAEQMIGRRACSSASSGVTQAYDFSAGSRRSIRRSIASVSSTGETFRAASSRDSSSICR